MMHIQKGEIIETKTENRRSEEHKCGGGWNDGIQF